VESVASERGDGDSVGHLREAPAVPRAAGSVVASAQWPAGAETESGVAAPVQATVDVALVLARECAQAASME